MRNLIISTAFIVTCFYIFGALGNADFNIGNWQESNRNLTFGLCGFVCVFAWLGIAITNSDKKL